MILMEEMKKKTTNFETIDHEDVIKSLSRRKIIKNRWSRIIFLEKDYNEIKLPTNKQSIEEVLIQRAVKSTIQILYDKGLFDSFPNVDEVLEDFLLVTRGRLDLEKKIKQHQI